MLYSILVVLLVIDALFLIGLILLQQGKGADAGAAFGSGASGTVFGARGSANFLSRTTAWLAAAFFVLSLTLAYFMHGRAAPKSVVDTAPPAAAKVEVPAPAVPKTDQPAAAPAPAAPVTDAKPATASKDAAKQPATPKVPE